MIATVNLKNGQITNSQGYGVGTYKEGFFGGNKIAGLISTASGPKKGFNPFATTAATAAGDNHDSHKPLNIWSTFETKDEGSWW